MGLTFEEEVDKLRRQGRKVGVIGVTVVRPFPAKELWQTLLKIKPKTVTVLDNSPSHFLHDDVVRTLKDTGIPVWGPVVYGLGGRDFLHVDARTIFDTLKAFSVIKNLGKRGSPVSLTKRLLRQLIEDDTIPLEYAEAYYRVTERFDALSNPEDIFNEEEMKILNSPQSEISEEVEKWLKLKANLQAKLNLQLMLIEMVKSGTYEGAEFTPDAQKMLETIISQFEKEDLKIYRQIVSHTTSEIKGRSISSILRLLEYAHKKTRYHYLSPSEIIDKLVNISNLNRHLGIFAEFRRPYFYGAERKHSQDKLIHALVIELAIRLSRKLLESEKGTPYERLVATECLLDLSQFRGDLKVAYEELNSLRALEGNPPQTERAKELLQINRERFKQL